MSRKIWQPTPLTPGWLQAKKDSNLTIHLPHPDGDVPMFFRRIKAGEFRMGSRGNDPREEPIHLVKIPDRFYLGTFPVTQAQYRAMATACLDNLQAIKGNGGIDPSHFKGDLRPVESVSWDDANAIASWLSASGLLPKGWHAGLPNEAQWEYACRAGTETEYSRGDGEASLGEVGWHGEDWDKGGTHPAGELPGNLWGLHDMHGNVWEWCADIYDPKAYRKRIDGWTAAAWSEEDAGKDAEGSENARFRVLRGGSWNDTAWDCRSADRFRGGPDFRIRFGGLRLCVFPGPGDPSQGPEAEPGAESAVAAAQPRDEAKQAKAGDGARVLDLSKAKLPAAKRPRKKPKK